MSLLKQQYKLLTMREPHALIGDVTAPLDRLVSHIPSTLPIGVMVVIFFHGPEVLSRSFLLFLMVILTVTSALQVASEWYGIVMSVKEHILA